MSHPVGAVPLSMFHEDGTMRKNVKADHGGKLEKHAQKHFVLPESPQCTTVIIRDAMSIVQMMDGDK